MAIPSSLELLSELAQERVDHASIALGQKRREQQHQEHQLEQIASYIALYQDGLINLGRQGASTMQFEQQRAFIQSLRKTQAHQAYQVKQASQRTQQALAEWQDAQRTLNAYDVLQTRREKARQGREKRLEQRQMDEFASRSQALMSGE